MNPIASYENGITMLHKPLYNTALYQNPLTNPNIVQRSVTVLIIGGQNRLPLCLSNFREQPVSAAKQIQVVTSHG